MYTNGFTTHQTTGTKGQVMPTSILSFTKVCEKQFLNGCNPSEVYSLSKFRAAEIQREHIITERALLCRISSIALNVIK